MYAPSICKGAVLFAPGAGGKDYTGLWMTTDGGDGSIPLPDDTLTIAQVGTPQSLSSCDSAKVPVLIANCGCTPADYHFDSVRVVGDGRFTPFNSSLFPKQWNGFASRDTIWLQFKPNHIAGPDSAIVHIYGRIVRDSVSTPFDSVLQVSASSSGGAPELAALPNAVDLGAINVCGNGLDTIIHIRNLGCATLTITEEDVKALGFAVDSLALPLVLKSGESTTLHIHILPGDTGLYSGTITLHAAQEGLTQLVVVSLQARGIRANGRLLAVPGLAQFANLSLCGSDSMVIALLDGGCDSLSLDSVSYAGDPDFTISRLSGADSLGSHDTVRYIIRFNPKSAGSRGGIVHLRSHSIHGSTSFDTTLTVSGTVTGSSALEAITSVFPPLSFCSTMQSSAMVINRGCDTITLDPGTITGDSDFHAGAPMPTRLAPGDTAYYPIQVIPRAKGSRNASLKVVAHDVNSSGSEVDTTLPLAANVVRGSALLASKTSALDLGTTPICQERDTFVVIQNTGCDTVCDSLVTIAPGTFQLAKAWSGRCLGPGERDTVWLSTVMDTSGHYGQNLATLSIVSNADTALPPITLAREIQYPAVWHLTISAPDSAYPGQPVIYKLLQHGMLPADDTAIDFVLHYDDDLLQFLSADEPLVSAGPAQAGSTAPRVASLPLHIAPVPADSVVATLHFTTFLAPNQQTTISVDSIAFSSRLARSSDCIALAQVDTSGFTIRTLCGATEILQELNNLPLTLDAVVPNPSHSEVTLYYSLAGSESVAGSIMLEDALGRTALSRSVTLEAGSSRAITLDLSSIPSGMYSVRLGTAAASVSRRIVKE